jgi:RNA polymerase subunit RPABC4/transcription elongation factor Spt4
VQVCSNCNTNTNDDTLICPTCKSDLSKYSVSSVFLAALMANPRVKMITLSVSNDACPTCKAKQGTYEKDQVPKLPIQGCSEPLGCTCTYQPILKEIYP